METQVRTNLVKAKLRDMKAVIVETYQQSGTNLNQRRDHE